MTSHLTSIMKKLLAGEVQVRSYSTHAVCEANAVGILCKDCKERLQPGLNHVPLYFMLQKSMQTFFSTQLISTTLEREKKSINRGELIHCFTTSQGDSVNF